MKKTVCRAFTLYHDKIYANTPKKDLLEELKKDYVVIGYFDWFKTKVWEMDAGFSLTALYEYNNETNREGTGFQSFQNIFGFRSDEPGSPCTDEEFWSSKKDECLKFILYLQMEKYSTEQFGIIEKVLKQNNQESFIIYFTLDKNDFIVCIASDKYQETIKTINDLYFTLSKEYNINIIYSYTNLMVRYDVINKPSSRLIAEKEGEELIDSICIKTILNNYNMEHHPIDGKIDRFCRSLSTAFYGEENAEKQREDKEIVGYEILGDTDCRFIARDVPLNRLRRLFSKDGLLYRNNELFKYCFISSMTSLNLNTWKEKSVIINNFGNYTNRIETLTDRRVINLIEKDLTSYGHLVTLLYQIYDYINFISYHTSKYEFVTLKAPFEQLIRLIKSAIVKNDERPFEELYEYLSNMYSNIQENMRTDIRFYGLSDFSVMSYYSPTKLRSFYFSVINRISNYYRSMSEQDRKIDYQFLIFFSNTATTNVTQLWKNKIDEDKIMLVKISEKDFYEVNDLVFQLAHEAAHFVGNEDIRNREYRFYQLINYFLIRVFSDIKKEINAKIKIMEKESNTQQAGIMQSFVDEAFKTEPIDQFIMTQQSMIFSYTQQFIEIKKEENRLQEAKYFFYTDVVKNFIGEYLFQDSFIVDFIKEYFNKIVICVKRRIMARLKNKSISVENTKRIISFLEDIRKELPSIIGAYSGQLLYTDFSDMAFASNILYEAYSDLSAVLLLDLKAVAFCDLMIKRLDLSDPKYVEDYGFIRMCFVLKAMNSMCEHYRYINGTFRNFFEHTPGPWCKGDDSELMKTFYQNITECCENLDTHENSLTYLYDYILLCLEKQCERINSEKRDEIIKIYQSVDDSELMNTVISINRFVAKLGESNDD